MSLAQFQPMLEDFWDQVVRDGERAKDSQHALSELERCYRDLASPERDLAETIFIEWIHGADRRRQFAGLAMIDRFSIVTALPALRVLAASLEESNDAAAPYDWAKVNRIVGRLVATRSTEGE